MNLSLCPRPGVTVNLSVHILGPSCRDKPTEGLHCGQPLAGPGPEVSDKGHLGSSGVGSWLRGHSQSPINPCVEKPEQLGFWGELPHCAGQRRWRGTNMVG